MSWENFYLIAFLVGFLLSAVSFATGAIDLSQFHFSGHASPFNLGTAAAFLAWFGGTGYLLERFSTTWGYLGLLISSISGLGGAAAVFWFLLKLTAHDQPLDPADYDMVGVLGRVGSPIRAKGTGELLYSRDGSRRAVPARCEDSTEIPRGTEVIVTRYEKGVAYVRRWEELSGPSL